MTRTAALAIAVATRIAAAQPVIAEEYALSLVPGFAKPEDVELAPATELLLVSEMGFGAPSNGGGLSAVPWSKERGLTGAPFRLWPSAAALPPQRAHGDSACIDPPDPAFYSGHGLSLLAQEGAPPLVAVVRHGEREAIELFELHGTGAAARARWAGCVPLPPDTAGNDVVADPDGWLFVTNYIPSVHGLYALVWLQLADWGWNTGDVRQWTPDGGWRALPGSEGAMPNGIARSDGRTLVAYNGASTVTVIAKGGAATTPGLALPGRPDNLNAAADGATLAALLHPTPPGSWSIARIDRGISRVDVLYTHDGARLPAVTAVAHDGERWFLGSMIGESIGVLSPVQRPSAAAR
jgi:hypothetical protein